MSTGPSPSSDADLAPLPASNGHTHSHSRSRGHTRSRYAQPPPIFLGANVNESQAPETTNPVNGGHSHGHASQHSQSHNHSHSHSSHDHQGHSHAHSHSHAHNHSVASIHDFSHSHSHQLSSVSEAHTESSPEKLHEIIAGSLIALPWVALSWYPHTCAEACQAPSATGKTPPFGGIGHAGQTAGVLTAFTLLAFGCGQLMRKHQTGSPIASTKFPTPNTKTAQAAFLQVCSIGLPIYASLKVGGFIVAFALLLATASGVPNLVQTDLRGSSPEKYSRKGFTIALLASVMVLGFFGLNQPWDSSPFMGYLALLTSVFVLSPPLPSLRHQGPIPEPGLVAESISKAKSAGTRSAVAVTTDAPLALVSGAFLLALGMIISRGLPFPLSDLLYILVPAGLLAISLAVSFPTGLRSAKKQGLAVCTGAAAILCSPHIRDEKLLVYTVRCILAVASFFASRVDDSHLRSDDHLHDHSHNHTHNHSSTPESTTRITKWVIHRSEPYPLLYSIVKEKDSRSIFYFMCLNFAFMLVQLSYGFVTGSLGLLSDSIHMFFDCLALVVGLCAAVMSKWPPNARFPYGYGKVDTLSGFANGISLMIISVEIIYEAVERLSSGSEMNRLGELLAVSFAGLLVNLVGIFSFEHGHHHGHDHGHDHGNENMHGIFLHILADTLGSVAVVISTILVHYSGWAGYDPLASCFIAILIFASAVPLVSSTAKSLLLALPADTEYNVRETLAGVSTLRGVVGYTVPKFWLDDTGSSDHAHDHAHGHDHTDHCHSHDQGNHDQGNHDHGHHDHDHDHDHNHDHSHSHEPKAQNVFGVIHVIASRGSDLEDVRQRTVDYLKDKHVDIVVQVERDGEGRCWCGGGNKGF